MKRAALEFVAGVFATSVLLVLALPLGEKYYLAWFALVPLMLATRDRGFLAGFVGALATIFLSAALSSTGLLYSHRDSEGLASWVYSGFGLFGFSFSIACGIASERRAWRRPAWWFAAIAVLLEACLLIRLPAHLALTQYRHLAMLQVASVGGVWLVSFLLWWANLAIARLPARSMAGALVLAVVVSIASQGFTLPASGPVHRYAAVQVPEADEDSLLAYHREASKAGAELVVWPEFSGLGFAPLGDTSRLRAISSTSAPFVTSFRDDATPLPHNAAALFVRGGESERYAKRRPFWSESAMHAPGDVPVSATLGSGRVGFAICFDSCYPYVIRDAARLPGVEVITLPAIDPKTTNDFIAAVHASFTPFRAAENGVGFVRSDGYAYSQIVDSRGVIVAEKPPGEGVLIADVQSVRRWTLSRFLGDWVLYVCGVLAIVGWSRGRDGSPRVDG